MGSSARRHGAQQAVSAARTLPMACAAALDQLAVRVQGESSTSVLPAPGATRASATARRAMGPRGGALLFTAGGSSVGRHGARRAASAARTVPMACAAALEPNVAPVQGESSTSAPLGAIATRTTGTATLEVSLSGFAWEEDLMHCLMYEFTRLPEVA